MSVSKNSQHYPHSPIYNQQLGNRQSFDGSIDIEELKSKNQSLYQENQMLIQSLQELIQINAELTSCIEVYNQAHGDGDSIGPNINQQEIQALAHQVIELEKQLESEKTRRESIAEELQKERNKQPQQPDANAQETIKVIEGLATSLQTMHQDHQVETAQMALQKQQVQKALVKAEQKYAQAMKYCRNLQSQNERKNQLIRQLESSNLSNVNHNLHEYREQPTKDQRDDKDRKNSTTIENLRMAMNKQIEEKCQIIKIYEELTRTLRDKISTS